MSTLKNKIDFLMLVSVTMANPNGDPLNGNRPRSDYEGYGEISDVCIKRKIRNRMQDMGENIFVKSNERADDGFNNLSERAQATIKNVESDEEYAAAACESWLDVRSFGQVFAFKKSKAADAVSVGVRGPVSIHQGVSASPIEIHSMQITKSVNSEPGEKRGSDTMGSKHMVRYGLYEIKGSINVQLAEKTGFSVDDSNLVKECLRTLFENDVSAARPDGSMEIYKLYWWQHDSALGRHSSAKVHRAVQVELKDGVDTPSSPKDYTITLEELDGLPCEVIDGL